MSRDDFTGYQPLPVTPKPINGNVVLFPLTPEARRRLAFCRLRGWYALHIAAVLPELPPRGPGNGGDAA